MQTRQGITEATQLTGSLELPRPDASRLLGPALLAVGRLTQALDAVIGGVYRALLAPAVVGLLTVVILGNALPRRAVAAPLTDARVSPVDRPLRQTLGARGVLIAISFFDSLDVAHRSRNQGPVRVLLATVQDETNKNIV